MNSAQLKNAAIIAGVAIIILALMFVAAPIGVFALVIGVPYMLFKAFYAKDHPFPKPWNLPKF